MVAVLALSQTGGGLLQRAIASPSTCVESTRDSRISRLLRSLYRQFTDRPARLISALAPSSSLAHSPNVRPSHPILRIDCGTGPGDRVRTTTSLFSETSLSVSKRPMKPLPPAMMIRFFIFPIQHEGVSLESLTELSCRLTLGIESIRGTFPYPADRLEAPCNAFLRATSICFARSSNSFSVVFPAMFALLWLSLILLAYGIIRIGQRLVVISSR